MKGNVAGGVLLIIAGVWVLTQVFAGNALGRLGISGSPTTPGKAATAPPGVTGQSGLGNGQSGGGAGGGGGGSF